MCYITVQMQYEDCYFTFQCYRIPLIKTVMVSLKWISLGIMAFQNGLTPLIFRHVMTSAKAEDRFQTVDAVFMQETLKLLLSILLLFWEEGQSFNMTMKTLSREIWDKPRDTLKLGIPAVLYFIQNVCLQLQAN